MYDTTIETAWNQTNSKGLELGAKKVASGKTYRYCSVNSGSATLATGTLVYSMTGATASKWDVTDKLSATLGNLAVGISAGAGTASTSSGTYYVWIQTGGVAYCLTHSGVTLACGDVLMPAGSISGTCTGMTVNTAPTNKVIGVAKTAYASGTTAAYVDLLLE